MTAQQGLARAYLWELQAMAVEERGTRGRYHAEADPEVLLEFAKGTHPDATDEARRAMVSENLKIPDHWPPAGPDERPGAYRLLHSMADQIEQHIISPFTRPVLGCLATGEINAVSLLVPGTTEHLVAFEDQLFDFAHLFSKAVALGMPTVTDKKGMPRVLLDPDDVRKHIARSPEAVRRFQEVVLAYLLRGEVTQAPQYFAPPHVSTTAAVLCEGMELFVLGHEYGHVLKGHLTDGSKPRRILGTGGADVTEVKWNWTNEHVADMTGWVLSVQSMVKGGVSVAMGHAGAELFLSACQVLGCAKALLLTGDAAAVPDSPTHPPEAQRRQLLRIMLERDVAHHAEAAIAAGQVIQEIVNILWRETFPFIAELHRNGARPHARWRG